MTQLDLFTRPSPPRHPIPSDPEIWEAVLHPDGYRRLAELMDKRHGADTAAAAADLRAFRAPDAYGGEPATVAWAGWMNLLEYRFSQGRAA